jgi:hypothetical protein
METYRDAYPSFSMNPVFDLSDLNSGYLAPNPYGVSYVPSKSHLSLPSRKRRHLWPCDNIDQSPRNKAHCIPVEIFSEVFLYTVQADPCSRVRLMCVCRHWYNIMLSTPGVHSQLRMYWWTERKDIEKFGRRWLLDVTIDMGRRSYVASFDAERSCDCFMAAAEASSRWRSLTLVSLPLFFPYKDFPTMKPLQHLESFKVAARNTLGHSLGPLMNAITTNVTSRLSVMEILDPDTALYLVQPAHLHVFSSLTALTLIL